MLISVEVVSLDHLESQRLYLTMSNPLCIEEDGPIVQRTLVETLS